LEEKLNVDHGLAEANAFDISKQADSNIQVNFDEMAENYFAHLDEIYQQFINEGNIVLDFKKLLLNEEEPNYTNLKEDILHEAIESLFSKV